MKILIQRLCIALAIFDGINQVNAAVTFTVTPAAISNTYGGTITLQVSGISSGSTVFVQKFLDADSNSVVDSSSLLWQQFQLTDGQASVFTNGTTSVTNFNVPGDNDGSANGSITANLYPGVDFSQLLSAKYFYVLSSPNSQFSPITNSFIVTNFPFAQKITGNVVNNGTNVPDAIVILLEPTPGGGQNPQSGAVANSSGAYTITAPPGSYVPIAGQRNFVDNMNLAPAYTLGAGMTIVTNITLTNATATISGRIVDTNNPSIGLPGMFVPCIASDNFLALVTSDTNGNFTVGVTADLWQVQPGSQSLDLHGYVEIPNHLFPQWNTTTGSVAGVTLPYTKGKAIFYGKVTYLSGSPMTGIGVSGDDNDNGYGLFEADTYTTTNGSYVQAVTVGDSWENYIYSKNQLPVFTNYLFSVAPSQMNGGQTFTNGQAVLQNFIGILATNFITGNITDSDGNPVAGLGVNVNATIGGVQFQNHTDTDTNGNYSVNVANGDWNVSVNCGSGGDGLGNIYPNGNFQCPNNQGVSINNGTGTVNFTIQLTGGQISGYLLDNNGNPIADVNISANDGMGDTNNGTTDDTGYYFINVGDGSWDVSVDCNELNALGYQCVVDDFVTISEDNAQANFAAQLLAPAPVFAFTTLYSFSAGATNDISLTTNSDGGAPGGALLLLGNTLYGTASYAGTNGAGTVFAISTTLANFTVLYTFSAPAADNNGVFTNSDGGVPMASLIAVSNVLYSTAAMGGSAGNGTVFKLSTNGANYTVVHIFNAGATNIFGTPTNTDGANPNAALLLSGNMLYSTALNGGTNGNGTIFATTTNGNYNVLYTFSAFGTNSDTNNDGAQPYSTLVQSGNTLYGTASQGGAWGEGTVFAINTNGTGFTVLYCFTNGTDGANPEAGLIVSSNVLYGTANSGGGLGWGTVFAISTNGTGFTVLHNFTDGDDGSSPQAGLVWSSNILYSTATYGGSFSDGTVFALNTTNLQLTVLHSFTGGNDGADPLAGLILSSNVLYGTAAYGGVNGSGIVFALSLTPLPPPPALSSIGYISKHKFQVTVSGEAGQNYTVQMITNILSTNWVSLLVTNPPSSSFEFTDTNATNQARYYRVLIVQ